jgi:PPK2 family polyphosphate:nucleotide phosphotransferase
MSHRPADLRVLLALPSGPVNLDALDPGATPGMPKAAKGKPMRLVTDRDGLASRQERLYAEASAGGTRSVLLVLQGIDTAGKGGVVKHVVGALEPIGVRYTAFKAPTAEEARHHFLWRIRRHLPAPGVIGVFDRSHYEDVLVPLVHDTLPAEQVERRYAEINRFESGLVAGGTTVIKCFLHISFDAQRDRLLARLDRPTKRWKFHESDLAERARWPDYQLAFAAMLEHCSTADAPWYVIPSDHKRYRNWAVGQILHHTLTELDPQYPDRELDRAGRHRLREYRDRLQPPN